MTRTEMVMEKTLGQVAFEAYNAAKGGVTYDGKPIPPWSDVGDAVRAAWEASARAVIAARPPLALYRLDSAAVYWVAAHGADTVVATICECEGTAPGDYGWDVDPPKVVELGEEQARAVSVRGDDGTSVDLWTEFCAEPYARVIACSEW